MGIPSTPIDVVVVETHGRVTGTTTPRTAGSSYKSTALL